MSTSIPDLEFRCPDCSLCGRETSAVEDDFDCESCNLTWDRRGESGTRMNPDLPQCESQRKPYAGHRDYPTISDHLYRCVLDEGHSKVHYGTLIAPRVDHNDTDSWLDASPGVVQAPGE